MWIYYFILRGDFSRFTWIFSLQNKYVLNKFKEFKAHVNNHIENTIRMQKKEDDGVFHENERIA